MAEEKADLDSIVNLYELYYRSTGLGNVRFDNNFKGTLVPFFGMKDGVLQKGNTLKEKYAKNKYKDLPSGFNKNSMISHTKAVWIYELLISLLKSNENKMLLDRLLIEETTKGIPDVSELSDNTQFIIGPIHEILTSYFITPTQLFNSLEDNKEQSPGVSFWSRIPTKILNQIYNFLTENYIKKGLIYHSTPLPYPESIEKLNNTILESQTNPDSKYYKIYNNYVDYIGDKYSFSKYILSQRFFDNYYRTGRFEPRLKEDELNKTHDLRKELVRQHSVAVDRTSTLTRQNAINPYKGPFKPNEFYEYFGRPDIRLYEVQYKVGGLESKKVGGLKRRKKQANVRSKKRGLLKRGGKKNTRKSNRKNTKNTKKYNKKSKKSRNTRKNRKVKNRR